MVRSLSLCCSVFLRAQKVALLPKTVFFLFSGLFGIITIINIISIGHRKNFIPVKPFTPRFPSTPSIFTIFSFYFRHQPESSSTRSTSTPRSITNKNVTTVTSIPIVPTFNAVNAPPKTHQGGRHSTGGHQVQPSHNPSSFPGPPPHLANHPQHVVQPKWQHHTYNFNHAPREHKESALTEKVFELHRQLKNMDDTRLDSLNVVLDMFFSYNNAAQNGLAGDYQAYPALTTRKILPPAPVPTARENGIAFEPRTNALSGPTEAEYRFRAENEDPARGEYPQAPNGYCAINRPLAPKPSGQEGAPTAVMIDPQEHQNKRVRTAEPPANNGQPMSATAHHHFESERDSPHSETSAPIPRMAAEDGSEARMQQQQQGPERQPTGAYPAPQDPSNLQTPTARKRRQSQSNISTAGEQTEVGNDTTLMSDILFRNAEAALSTGTPIASSTPRPPTASSRDIKSENPTSPNSLDQSPAAAKRRGTNPSHSSTTGERFSEQARTGRKPDERDLQGVALRDGLNLDDYSSPKTWTRARSWMAIEIARKGELMAVPCERCSLNRGIFKECRRWKGGLHCANCTFTTSPGRCEAS